VISGPAAGEPALLASATAFAGVEEPWRERPPGMRCAGEVIRCRTDVYASGVVAERSQAVQSPKRTRGVLVSAPHASWTVDCRALDESVIGQAAEC